MKKAELIEMILNDMARKQIKTRAIIDREWKGWLNRQKKAEVEHIARNRKII